ncbi:hypothetical protein HJC23_001358 [Cyclotella cryptica]|uniref:Phosphoribulokinase/uridine kinase domain-containing protein n=1 Tax=Cyclotella cryptica TaxID=29204 RepID=A0ABD3PMZ6_9STRA
MKRIHSTLASLPALLFCSFANSTSVTAFSPPPFSLETSRRLTSMLHVTPNTQTSTTDDKNMLSTYDTLSTRLIERHQTHANSLRNNQLFVCIAGGPGSGKSTLAHAVATRINSQLGSSSSDGAPAAVVLPMDGFHYTRSELRSMGDSPSIPYTYEELIARRGAPWTFDAEGCIAAFREARIKGDASLPIYCRVKSDPVPNGVTLCRRTKIVLLEGNYLLAWQDERWAPLKEVFDECWYITCKSLQDQRQRLVYRHLETWTEEKTKMWGEGEEGAGKKADSNDMLNAEWVDTMSRTFADLIVESF